MASYEDKQLFKKRFWKHVWELDSESLDDLLQDGNPIGHVNFPFRVPSDGYQWVSKTDRPLKETADMIQSRENYFTSCGKTAAAIVWDFLFTFTANYDLLYVSSWAIVDDPEHIHNMLEVLRKHGATLHPKITRTYRWMSDHNLEVEINDLFTFSLARHLALGAAPKNCLRAPTEEEERDKIMAELFQFIALTYPWDSLVLRGRKYQCLQLVLLYYPERFNYLYTLFQVPKYYMSELIDWCKNTDIAKRLWKLRLVKLDSSRWPTMDAFDDVSAEELQAMYEGHPKNINFRELAVSDRSAKKAKLNEL